MFSRVSFAPARWAAPFGGFGNARVVASLLTLTSMLWHGALGAQSRAATGTAGGSVTRAAEGVVTIVAYRDGSGDVVSGAGFRVADGRVITALRLLRGAARAEIFAANGDVLGTLNTLDQAEARLDIAVLPRLSGASGSIALARRSALLASRVSLLGPRKGVARAVTERTVTAVEPDDDGRPLLRLGAAITSTSIGSPVVNARGELVGVAVGSIPGRDDGDITVDVSAIRELLARPAVRLSFPNRDGTITAARAPASDARSSPSASRATDIAARSRSGNGIFPERYGAAIGTDSAGRFVVELFGCAHLEVRKKVYCFLRVTNNGVGATFAVDGGDLSDSTQRKLRSADNLILGETAQRVAGWRKRAEVPLRELEAARIAFEFDPPERAGDAVRLMVDVSGERRLWFGPFVIQRAP
jgi:Trypsin-like peptidase domain